MKKIVLGFAAALMMFSCSNEISDSITTERYGDVKVRFMSDDFVEINTKAAQESFIRDVTVLQFKNGILVKKILLENQQFSQSVPINGLVSIPASLLDEKGNLILNGKENVICFLGNVNRVGGDASKLIENNTTYTQFQNFVYTPTSYQEVLPMMGSFYGGIVEGATNQIAVNLSRSVAKINFTVDVTPFKEGGNPVPAFVKTIRLVNAPKAIKPVLSQYRPALPTNEQAGVWPLGMQPYPAYSAADFTTIDVADNQSLTPLSNFIAYMPTNARGSFSNLIATNREKKPESLAPQYQSGLSYIELTLGYTLTNGTENNAVYKIYIGGDNKGDMNILSNVQYNIKTTVFGANTSDTRITVTKTFNPEVTTNTQNLSIQPLANTYIINPASIPNGFTIPLAQARAGWGQIQTLEQKSDLVSTFDALIKSGNWEIKTLWKTWTGTTKVSGAMATGITTPGGGANNYFATLTFDAGIPNGNNAVVALVGKADNKVYWSWHLWFTDYNPNATVPAQMNGQTHTYFGAAFTDPAGIYYNGGNPKRMMDRNLGATVTGVTGAISQPSLADAPKYFGLMYQPFRKDPFIGAATANAFLPIYDAAGNSAAMPNEDRGFNVNLTKAVQNPLTLFTIASGQSVGSGYWTNLTTCDLWNNANNVKSTFDPCPPGYRVPRKIANNPYGNVWAGFSNNDPYSVVSQEIAPQNPIFAAAGTSNPLNFGRLYKDGTTQAWFPASGHITNASTRSINLPGVSGYMLTAIGSSNFARERTYPDSNLNVTETAVSVRCIQE